MRGKRKDAFSGESGLPPIAQLNDRFRKTGEGGNFVVTRGVAALGAMGAIMQMVKTFDDFSADNDPHGERDFGSFTFHSETIFWKIDYYDSTMTLGSPDPSNPEVTKRLLTIMLASEY